MPWLICNVGQNSVSVPYFLVHSVETKEGVAVVDGRLGDVSIRLGHVFDRSFASVEAWRERKDGVPCALVVRGVEAYGKQLEELSPGLSARLLLSGSHLSALKASGVIE
jgi:hypothetical protein